MLNLRRKIEQDLSRTIEREYGLPVSLVSPAGEEINTSVHTGEQLYGQILYESVRVNPDTGEEIVLNNPAITLRRSSLSRVPEPNETWLVRIPTAPTEGAPIEDFVFDSTRAPEGGQSIGYITLYLRRATQS